MGREAFSLHRPFLKNNKWLFPFIRDLRVILYPRCRNFTTSIAINYIISLYLNKVFNHRKYYSHYCHCREQQQGMACFCLLGMLKLGVACSCSLGMSKLGVACFCSSCRLKLGVACSCSYGMLKLGVACFCLIRMLKLGVVCWCSLGMSKLGVACFCSSCRLKLGMALSCSLGMLKLGVACFCLLGMLKLGVACYCSSGIPQNPCFLRKFRISSRFSSRCTPLSSALFLANTIVAILSSVFEPVD